MAIHNTFKSSGMVLYRVLGVGLVWLNRDQVEAWKDFGYKVEKVNANI
jgi:hypothetical protein